jgi:hypothetical protein
LLYAQDYEPTRLKELFPELEFLQAIDTLVEIHEKTDHKAMYDANLKAIRDRVSELRTAEARGEMLGKMRMLQSILGEPEIGAEEFASLDPLHVEAHIKKLQEQVGSGRRSS